MDDQNTGEAVPRGRGELEGVAIVGIVECDVAGVIANLKLGASIAIAIPQEAEVVALVSCERDGVDNGRREGTEQQ